MNKGEIIIIMIFALCALEIHSQNVCLSGEPLTEAGQFYCSVDEAKRDLLIIHYLTDALVANAYVVFPDQRLRFPRIYFGSDAPENFAQNLLDWVATRTSRSYADVAILVSEANTAVNANVCTDVCYDGATCNPDKDIGCTCCPW